MENFGFKKVSKEEKPNLVNKVFDNVAFRYDLMNDLMSAGLHRLWKDSFIDWLAPRKNTHLLDVAGGTGDIAFRFSKKTKNQAKVTILDRNENMLNEGKRRLNVGQIAPDLEWVCGDAMNLPFKNEIFDYYTISFGIRNVLDLKKCLSEALRVLKPGGRIMILEFSKVENETLNKIYDAFSFNVVPRLGKLIANDAESYQYLIESIRKFPSQEKLASLVSEAGFRLVKYRNLTQGVVAMHSGWKV
ncbi:MAG: bifunctional demethylmenaquinone methyltransferase/2-methoxy-6-polyprenyl-1,4-benzoquinol methylase UbiE [Pseudomonadota bacterium]|jgi:demethylmenaquinone methyltransferase/2-methoxy-6-polyprenyl-1,4-benzoquinol methylase|nr:bifunctional demethylmenaquinone methyltransferase/2-methoxy-6-polyprenyl-1,4-benzoquinol methylase UbiE [Pseudomonadota bacterium]